MTRVALVALPAGCSGPAARPEAPAARRGLAVGAQHACAWDADGNAWCWGDNSHGELGLGHVSHCSPPARIQLADVIGMIARTALTCAETRDRAIYCWGDNDHAIAGPGGGAVSSPRRVTALDQ